MNQQQEAVTLGAVAAAAGVSRSTVSRVIRGAPVGSAALAQVREAMSRLGYVSRESLREARLLATDGGELAPPDFPQELDAILRALSDPTRRATIEILAAAPASVSGLANRFSITPASMLQHLESLERARIITSQKTGRVRTVSLRPGGLDPLHLWLGAQRTSAERQADRLGVYLSRPTKEDN